MYKQIDVVKKWIKITSLYSLVSRIKTIVYIYVYKVYL